MLEVDKAKPILSNLIKSLFGEYNGKLTYLVDLNTSEICPKEVTMIFAGTPDKKQQKKFAGGYFWKRFPKGESPDEIEEKMERHVITFSKRQLTGFPIMKYSDGRDIQRYRSVMDAILDSNMAPTKILNSLELNMN